MKTSLRYAALAIGMALSGCTTHLTSMSPGDSSTNEAPQSGVSYNLARLEYQLEIRRTATGCPTVDAPELEVEFEASAGSSYGAGEEVILDYASLAEAWKTTSVNLETYPSGILKSVNAQAADQTGPAIKAGVGLAVGVAKLIIGVPPISASSGTSSVAGDEPVWRAILVCSKTGENLLKAYKGAVDERDRSANARDAAKAELAGWDADNATTDKLSDKQKADRALLATKARTAEKAAIEAATSLTKARAPLSFSTRALLDTSKASSLEHKVLATEAGPWLARLFQIRLIKNGAKPETLQVPSDLVFPDSLANDKRGAARNAVQVAWDRTRVFTDFRSLRPTKSVAADAASRCSSARGAQKCGILYRAATPARLQVCKDIGRADQCSLLPAGHVNLLLRDEKNAPQLGGVRSLPLQNDAFESNSLIATFREDSTLATVAYGKTSAELVGALGAANDAVSGVAQIDAYNRARSLRRTGNDTARANAQTELNEALKKAAEAELSRREAEAKLKALTEASDDEE